MLKILTTAAAAMLMIAQGVHAQPHSYGALQERPIKALSADDIAGLRAGRGMGMALPAELNRYPGPMHVLEHAAKLALTPEQMQEVRRQFEAMRAAAMPLGDRIVAGEEALEALFRSGAAEAAAVDRVTSEIAALYGQLRAVHLRTHLATRATLTEPQLAMYQTLRGYDGKGPGPTHKH